MLCKYCKKDSHVIDDCPEIICKKCRIVGHPFWKCKNTPKGGGTGENLKDKDKDRDRSGKGRQKRNKDKYNRTKDKRKLLDGTSGLLYRNGIKNSTVEEDSVLDKTRTIKEDNVEKNKIFPAETYANIIISGDNRLAYYLKFKGVKWGEML